MLRNHLATTTWTFTSSFHHSQSTLLHAKIKNADEPQNCRKLDLFLVKVNKTILQFGYQSRVRAYFLWSYFDCNSYENTTIYKVFVCTHVDFNIQLLIFLYYLRIPKRYSLLLHLRVVWKDKQMSKISSLVLFAVIWIQKSKILNKWRKFKKESDLNRVVTGVCS